MIALDGGRSREDDGPVGTIYLRDGTEIDVPHIGALAFETNGWLTVEREGVATHFPPTRVDRVELDIDRDATSR